VEPAVDPTYGTTDENKECQDEREVLAKAVDRLRIVQHQLLQGPVMDFRGCPGVAELFDARRIARLRAHHLRRVARTLRVSEPGGGDHERGEPQHDDHGGPAEDKPAKCGAESEQR
jgi:hypothetical protein